MRERDRGVSTDFDSHDLFFGSSDDDQLQLVDPDDHQPSGYSRDPRYPSDPGGYYSPAYTPAGSHGPRHGSGDQRGGRRGVFALFALLLVVVVGTSAWFVGLPIYHYLSPSDYSGNGTTPVVVTVHANDGAAQIGDTLVSDDVVASRRAFTSAASDNDASQNIQPGSYRLRRHMSAKAALGLLLNPSSKIATSFAVPEGATSLDIEKRLTAPPCTSSSPSGTVCGLGVTSAVAAKALRNVKALGLPTDFTVGDAEPTSAEGFLYPATYAFDESTTATDALQQMISKFTDQAKTTNFTVRAKALGITPYAELIVASIAQSEAKFPADMPKVARVILNRIAQRKNLQIDAISAYECKLAGTDPTKCIYDAVPGPYNSYNHVGLPPTPISNPGAPAMSGAAHPATGNWLFYVNGDAAGHLFFTNSETAFKRAAAKCKLNHWGCG